MNIDVFIKRAKEKAKNINIVRAFLRAIIL